ncbi:hypothetical protein L3Q82_005131 [Scortum barcoo]|uniref:Uncharacterized protein n=1 Tax=Scortum barcoo TaxID=214431 RepID=A0ACB8VE35_9TELE|nr:hypothetical protein L3Q82_005131 [Scortum barcoo]
MFSASIVGSSKLWDARSLVPVMAATPNLVVEHRKPSKPQPWTVLEAKTRVWEEFGEAMEEDYRLTSKRFWQTVRRLRRGKQYSANTVYSAGLCQGTGEENSADSPTLGFRRNNAVFVPVDSTGVLEGLWEFAQPVHMCFVDLEKAFDRVPRGILWGCSMRVWGSGAFLLRAVRSLYDRSRSLVRIAGRFLGVARGNPEGVRFGNHRISSLLFADDVVLMASSGQDLQHVLERFAAECEAAGMRISTSKSEAMVLDRKRVVACPLRVGGEVLPQVEEFKYLGVLFTSEGKMEREIDRWRIGAASAVMRSVYCPDRRGEEGAESKGEALDLPVNLRSHPHLWS